jgi:DcaP outer membrane protein
LINQQLELLHKRLDTLERQQQGTQALQAPSSNVKWVKAGDFKNSFKFPDSQTSLALGGYAKFDAAYNSVTVPNSISYAANQLYIPAQVPLSSQIGGQRGQTQFNARETRIWIKSFTPATAQGDFTAYAELDFIGTDGSETTGNSHGARLRLAYGRLGNWLFGQTASTLLNLASIPEVSDQGLPIGYILIRQPTVQYTHPLNFGSWQVSIENPESTLWDSAVITPSPSTNNRRLPADDRYPDFVGRLNWESSWGQVSLASLIRQLRSDGTVVAAVTDEKWGGVLGFAGLFKLGEQDRFRFNLMAGNALGRYMGNSFFPDGYLSPQGQITLINEWGGYGSYQHWWASNLRSNWTMSVARADNPVPLQGTSANKKGSSSHLHLVWNPIPPVTLFVEWLHANRQQENNESGKLDRLTVSGKFEF